MKSYTTFGFEQNQTDRVLPWLNSHVAKTDCQIEIDENQISTENFGHFTMLKWKGDLQLARKTIQKLGKKFKIKTIEGAYRQKERALRLKKYDYALVRSSNKVIGHLEFSTSRFKSNHWQVSKEERR